MTFYAQNGEDRWLSDNWSTLGLPDKGIFVDVGAGDGVRISNTLWLEERGWTGLLIEPDARHFASILENRRANFAPIAVGSHNRPFCRFTEDAEYSGFLRTDGDMVIVPISGLNSVLDFYDIPRIDVLSIDTEGTELEVWGTLDLLRWRPKVVFIEWLTDGIGSNECGIKVQMAKDGYRLAKILGCNLVFVEA